jgi:hypothetical protein
MLTAHMYYLKNPEDLLDEKDIEYKIWVTEDGEKEVRIDLFNLNQEKLDFLVKEGLVDNTEQFDYNYIIFYS